ncbi:hypothetical protein NMG60_11029934 [Bertholletia excelsa]
MSGFSVILNYKAPLMSPFHHRIDLGNFWIFSSLLFAFLFGSILLAKSMRIHPVPVKGNAAIHDEPSRSGETRKRLRRLPHVFGKVLELPFRSDADVFVEETPEVLRFVAGVDEEDLSGGIVRVHAVEIHPGVTKIVVRNGDDEGEGEGVELMMGELEVDVWRFRLPAAARPELATAEFIDGELIVRVPKSEEVDDAGGEMFGGFGRLVAVQ